MKTPWQGQAAHPGPVHCPGGVGQGESQAEFPHTDQGLSNISVVFVQMHIREPSRVLVIPVQFSSHMVDYPRQSRSDLLPYQPVLSGMGNEVLRWEEARSYFLSFLINTPTTDKYPRRTFPVWLLETGFQEQPHPEYPQLQAELHPLPRLKFAPLSPNPIALWQGALSAAQTGARHGARDGFLGSPRGDANGAGDCSRSRDRQMLLHFKGNRALGGFQEYAQIDRLLSNTEHICSSVRQLFPEDGGRTRPLTAIRAGWGTCGGSRSASPARGAEQRCPGPAFSSRIYKMPSCPQGFYREHISVIQPMPVQCSAPPFGEQHVCSHPLHCSSSLPLPLEG